MATYAIGDIQGCYDELCDLLEKIKFDPTNDHLWIAGDMVNRGSQSLLVLQFLYSLENNSPLNSAGESQHKIILGNHDLHLLASSIKKRPIKSKDTFQDILDFPERELLLHWLRSKPLLHYDAALDFAMLHAGLVPQWQLKEALAYAQEVQEVLRNNNEYPTLLESMYGNAPVTWSDSLKDWDRLRFIINTFTRLRYCTDVGAMSLNAHWPPGTQPDNYAPWFSIPGRRSQATRIIFGHWAALNGEVLGKHNVYALDTGCVWGGRLRALRLEDQVVFEVPSRQKRVF